jgi:hypothetical protein
MGQITGGTVNFGRTVQPAQYESKKADVTLTFVLAEGEDMGEMLNHVALAQAKALEMVGLKAQAASAPAAAKTEPTATAETAKTSEKAPKTPRVPKKPVAADPAPPTAAATPEAVAKALTALDDLGPDKPQISTGEERVNPAEIQDEFPDTVAEITDEQLDKIGHAFINSGVPGAGKKIRDLRDEWTGKPGQPLRTLAKEKRQAFVDALGKLT